MPMSTSSVVWEKAPDKRDCPAATSHLDLIAPASRATTRTAGRTGRVCYPSLMARR